jgi:glutamate-1-semialdehyde 2,1-aminomutase
VDVDGFEYIDWISGIGAILLGYADPVVDEAVCRQLSLGTMYSVNHELEVELAERLCALIPCAEMVRYAKSGGEACAMAVRIARGATGRDRVLFCGYHGWHDWYIAANLADDAVLNGRICSRDRADGSAAIAGGDSTPIPMG